jgi:hypothetical protein
VSFNVRLHPHDRAGSLVLMAKARHRVGSLRIAHPAGAMAAPRCPRRGLLAMERDEVSGQARRGLAHTGMEATPFGRQRAGPNLNPGPYTGQGENRTGPGRPIHRGPWAPTGPYTGATPEPGWAVPGAISSKTMGWRAGGVLSERKEGRGKGKAHQ